MPRWHRQDLRFPIDVELSLDELGVGGWLSIEKPGQDVGTANEVVAAVVRADRVQQPFLKGELGASRPPSNPLRKSSALVCSRAMSRPRTFLSGSAFLASDPIPSAADGCSPAVAASADALGPTSSRPTRHATGNRSLPSAQSPGHLPTPCRPDPPAPQPAGAWPQAA